jgi:hypothetical protein
VIVVRGCVGVAAAVAGGFVKGSGIAEGKVGESVKLVGSFDKEAGEGAGVKKGRC